MWGNELKFCLLSVIILFVNSNCKYYISCSHSVLDQAIRGHRPFLAEGLLFVLTKMQHVTRRSLHQITTVDELNFLETFNNFFSKTIPSKVSGQCVKHWYRLHFYLPFFVKFMIIIFFIQTLKICFNSISYLFYVCDFTKILKKHFLLQSFLVIGMKNKNKN